MTNRDQYKLEEIIEISLLQDLLDRLNKVYSFPLAIIDNEGKVLVAVAWQDICTKFHRQNPVCEKECIKSDQYILEHLHEAKPAVSYECPHGLIDNAMPIIIDGQHLANFFTGQFFLKEPDTEVFKKQAKKYGFDEDEYLEAMAKVPVWTKEKLEKYLHFMRGFMEVIAGIGLRSLKEKEIGKKLQQEQNRYKSILATSSDGYWLVNLNGEILEVNDAYCQMSGYSEQELLKMSVSDFEVVEGPQQTRDHIRNVVQNGNDRFLSKHKSKDGSVFDVEVNAQNIIDNKDHIVVFIRDVSERIKAEEELHDSKERFKHLSNLTFEGVLIHENGIVVDANQSLLNMFGYTQEEVIGKNIFQLAIPQKYHQEIQGYIKSKSVDPYEIIAVKKDGTSFPVEIVAREVIIDGKTLRVAAVRDITERKKLDKDRELNEKRLEALVELGKMTTGTDDEVFDFTLNKAIELTQSQIGFLGFVNEDESEVDIYKWSDVAMKDCNIPDINFNFVIAESGLWGDVVRNRKPMIIDDYHSDIENKIGLPQGHLNIENYLSIPTFKGEKMYAIVAVANKQGNYTQSDLNQLTLLLDGMRRFLEEREEKEQLIIAKHKAEESERLKSAFLSNMSHEIRTPMNGILGFLSLLNEPGLSKEQKDKYTEVVESSSKRLMNTIDSIIDISRIETGVVPVNISSVNVNDTMQSMVDFFIPEANAKGLDLLIDRESMLPELICDTDQEKIESVFTNLIKNAIKFTENGQIHVGYKIKDDKPVFYVKDTGCGIEKDKIDIVFNRFRQADEELSRGYEGSGLGLAICKGYLELLDGSIWLESEFGKGSTFYFDFDCKVKDPQVSNKNIDASGSVNDIPTETTADADVVTPTILIAEDDPTSMEFLKEILQKVNVRILHAENGEEAIDLTKKNPGLSLILMDIRMPVMNGLEAIKEIRKSNKDIPIIAQTAYALSEEKNTAMKAGCTDYITKPVSAKLLLEKISEYISDK